MRHITSFPKPYLDKSHRILILGTITLEINWDKAEYFSTLNENFWKAFYDYLGEPLQEDSITRLSSLVHHAIGVWDLIKECDIADATNNTIINPVFNDLQKELNEANIELILLNGKDAFEMFEENFKEIPVPYKMMPYTGVTSDQFDDKPWREAFDSADIYGAEIVNRFLTEACLLEIPDEELYKVIRINGKSTYVFNEEAISETCAACGLSGKQVEDELIKRIEKGKLSTKLLE